MGSSNKNLIKIIKKKLGENKRCWHGKLKYALWEDRITSKRAKYKIPFQLVRHGCISSCEPSVVYLKVASRNYY